MKDEGYGSPSHQSYDCPLHRFAGPDDEEELPGRETHGSCGSAYDAEERVGYRRGNEKCQGTSSMHPSLESGINPLLTVGSHGAAFEEEGMPGASGNIAGELPKGFTDSSGETDEKRVQYRTQRKYQWDTGDEGNDSGRSQYADQENAEIAVVLKFCDLISKKYRRRYYSDDEQCSYKKPEPPSAGMALAIRGSLICLVGSVVYSLFLLCCCAVGSRICKHGYSVGMSLMDRLSVSHHFLRGDTLESECRDSLLNKTTAIIVHVNVFG